MISGSHSDSSTVTSIETSYSIPYVPVTVTGTSEAESTSTSTGKSGSADAKETGSSTTDSSNSTSTDSGNDAESTDNAALSHLVGSSAQWLLSGAGIAVALALA